jgi:hypothetical protein
MRSDARVRRARPPLVRGERGQTFPFVLVLLFSLFVTCAVVINIGQAVNRRIFLQIAADAGAYTGASEMARGMNTIAEINGQIQKAWGNMTYATKGFGLPPCGASDLGVGGYAQAAGAGRTLIDAVNKGYGKRARSEAERVTKYNVMDLFPTEEDEIQMGEVDSENGLRSPRPEGKLVDLQEVRGGTPAMADAMTPAVKRAVWACKKSPTSGIRGLLRSLVGGTVEPRSATFPLWYEKAPGPPFAFIWVVKAPARRARVFDAVFGPEAIPAMTAAAAAKPVGGSIKEAKVEYVTKLIPVRDFRGGIYDRLKRLTRKVHH